MALLSARRCGAIVVLAVVLILGIALGALFPSMWPFATAAETKAAPAATANSARKIAEAWASGLGSGQQWTITAAPRRAPGAPTVIHMGSGPKDDHSAAAFVVFMTRTKFEEVWKHFADKCGFDGPKEALARGTRMNPEDLRGGMVFGKGKDEHLQVDFAGIGAAKPGADPAGGRESHFGYFTDGYVVHVVIEEVGQDRWESYKGQVKVRILAALR
jgi:hypothetical protein